MMKIGFCSENESEKIHEQAVSVGGETAAAEPRKSLVRVSFKDREGTLAYYNDSYDLNTGDIVFVEGKHEGKPGKVEEVNYNFRVKRSEYRRVISVADTAVHGEFFCAGDHFVTFDPVALPAAKVRSWFFPPLSEDDDIICGSDGRSFNIHMMSGAEFSPEIAERGHGYYVDNKVRYISLAGGRGYAIVEGGRPYEVEFDYDDGNISNLTCSCPCGYNCKHEFAAMIQLMETLDRIGENYGDRFEASGYFAAVLKQTLVNVALSNTDRGSLTL